MKIIFLDIDGVVNGFTKGWDAWSPQIWNVLIRRLNEIIVATGAKIVLSSSWRQYIHNGYMTELGFWKMLCTHGLTSTSELIGVTRQSKMSEDSITDFRGRQIADWIADHKGEIESFVILDDMTINGFPDNFVKTHSDHGLSDADVEKAIKILGREKDG
jgi:hypothetical protein